MVRHITAHLLAVFFAAAGGSKVERLNKAEAAVSAEAFKLCKIPDAAARVRNERKKRGVRRYDHIVIITSAQSESGAAVSLVAVVEP